MLEIRRSLIIKEKGGNKLVCIISGGYTQCHFHCIFSAAMICLKRFCTCIDEKIFFLLSPMTISEETARNNGLKFCTKGDLFAYQKADLFILFFLSTSVALIILHLHQLFRDFENFMSLFGHFGFSLPTHFPEVSCPRCDPASIVE